MAASEAKAWTAKGLEHPWLVPLSVFLTAIFMSVLPAGADDFPDNHHDGLADSAAHTYCFQSWESDANVGHYAMRNALDATTDMWDIHHSNCLNSTDVVFRDLTTTSTTLRGRYTCRTFVGDRCNRSTVDLFFANIDVGTSDWSDRRKTSVHEVGHSVGANHDSISAMITGEVPSTVLQWKRFSTHDINHINANY